MRAVLRGRCCARCGFGEKRARSRRTDHQAAHLLTPNQQGCTSLLYRDDESNARTVKVGVYEVHDKACGGDPDVMHRLFDLEIDLTTGAAKWDNNFPDMEMRPVPQRAR